MVVDVAMTEQCRMLVGRLGLGALVHAVGFATLHRIDQPLVTGLPMAVSFMAWIGVLLILLLMWRLRIPA